MGLVHPRAVLRSPTLGVLGDTIDTLETLGASKGVELWREPRAAERAMDQVRRVGDPLVDLMARWRAKRALGKARTLVDGIDEIHALRLAFLDVAGVVPEGELGDRTAIELEFKRDRANQPERGRRWWATFTLVTVLVASVMVFVTTRPERRFDPRREPLGLSLSKALPHFVVLLSSRAAGQQVSDAVISQSKSEVLSEGVRREIGEEGVSRLDALLARVNEASAWAPSRDAEATKESARAALDGVLAASGALDALLAKQHVPYFIDTDVLRGPNKITPLLLSFYVEREDEAIAADQHVRVLRLWRLDQLNMNQSGLLGYTRPRTQAALVLLDQVESHLVQYLLPAAGEGEEVEMIDPESLDPELTWQKDFQRGAGDVVRRVYGTSQDPAVASLGKLLARRRALVRRWASQLVGLGLVFRVPQRLVPEADYSADLRVKIPRAELIEWDELHDTLLSRSNEAVFVKLRDRYAETVERHEVQHRLDYARGFTPVPAPLAEVLGLQNPLDAPEGGMAARSRDEMSAHLAELTRVTPDSALDILLLSRFLMDRTQWGTPYHVAALVIFTELANELGLNAGGPLVLRGRVRRERVATLTLEITSKPPNEVAAAAKKIWERLYGEPLLDVETRLIVQRPVWRH